jgi:hypothetical protein
MGNAVGRDKPEHDILEEPHEHLALDRWERRALSRGENPAGSAGVQRWRARKLSASMTSARCRCRPSQRQPYSYTHADSGIVRKIKSHQQIDEDDFDQ